MDGAGLSIKELLYWDDNGKPPASVDRQQFKQFLREYMALDDSKATEAIDKIVKHARTECDIDLLPE
jgi:hypothetical protein